MNKTDDQVINQIIHSFEVFGLADIKHNKKRPIAAYILCICFIDQLGSFAHEIRMGEGKRAEAFIKKYIPAYAGIGLYTKLRNPVIHNYSPNEKFALTSDKLMIPFEIRSGVTIINMNVLIRDLTKGFGNFKNDLQMIHSAERRNALNRYEKNKIFIQTT